MQDQAVPVDAQHEHVLFDGSPAPFAFSFAYEPASCNVDQYYKIMVDNQEMDPSWLKIDSTVHPPTAQIINDDTSYAGVYSVSIYGYLNTIPATVSADQVRFVVSLNLEQCSTLQFNDQLLNDIHFTIGGPQDPVTEVFPEFTNTVPVGDTCGPREYLVYQGHDSLTFDEASRTFTVSSTDPSHVGTQEILLLVQLKNYPQFNPVV